MNLTRRAVIAGTIAGGGAVGAAMYLRRSKRAEPFDLEPLIDSICLASPKTVLTVAADALSKGASLEQLLWAAFLAPLVTGGEGEDVHSMLVVPSIQRHFMQRGQKLEQWLPALWAVCNAQSWSKRERMVMPSGSGSLTEISVRLSRGLRERDVPAADATVAAMTATSGVQATAARLRLEASFGRADPHAAIYAAQASRALSHLDARYAEPLLRSVGRYLARSGPPAPEPDELRLVAADTTSPDEIARAMIEAPTSSLDGLSSRAIWEALALLAIETRYAEDSPTGPGVHDTTLLDALWFIHDQAAEAERTRILARAVQAVVALYRPATAAKRADEVRRAQVQVRSHPSRFVDGLRTEVALKGVGEHDFKYFAAVEDISPRLSPLVRERWLAAAVLAHPIGSASQWERRTEVEALVARFS